jgi:homoserine kinase type II
MAVYTEVSDEDLDAFLQRYDLGRVLSCKGIAEGIENSNFLLQTETGNYILTLYERRVARRDLPYFLALMAHLAAHGVACPTPVRARNGEALGELSGKPAAIVGFLMGQWPRRSTAEQCSALGEAMARLHEAGRSFAMTRANDLSLAGWRSLIAARHARADELQPGLGAELDGEIAALERAWPRDLPEGVIHADLFPDNVFFLGDKLSGIIDFYFACNDILAYDLAIAMNAWCFEPDGSFNVTKARALFSGYARVRPLAAEETAALPVLARGAALRFAATRLYDWFADTGSALVRRKDPLEYVKKLRFHRGVAGPAAYGLA